MMYSWVIQLIFSNQPLKISEQIMLIECLTVLKNTVRSGWNQSFACLWSHFDRGLAQYKHATLPLSFLGLNTTLLGFPKRCITLVYLKGLKSYQPSKFKRVDFLSFWSRVKLEILRITMLFFLAWEHFGFYWNAWILGL